MRLGVHVSIQGGFCEALKAARKLGCEAMQVFISSPRNWAASSPGICESGAFRQKRAEENISPLVVHVSYLINLSSPEDALYKKSIESFINEIKSADEIGADYFVTHLGSHRGKGDRFGINRFAKALNTALAKVKPELMILLEATAGSGDSLGYRFEHLRDIIKRITKKEKVGICLDTAHVYAAGYDIATRQGLAQTLKSFDRLIGIKRLKVVHLNDSKGILGSRIDRHDHIGKGKIGKEGMKRLLNNPLLRGLTFILETPKDSRDADKRNLALVRKLARVVKF